MKQKTFTIKTVSRFSAAHVIPGHPGICARLHGHNFRMEVEVKGTQLNEIGILIDFQDLKSATQNLIDKIDHRYLNEIPPFDKISPTAENIAQWAYFELKKQLNEDVAHLSAVSVWESENSGVRFTEEEV
ncbi:MAG: 6-carboxytetrahydropterin synthase QueD [Legionellales bacterium]|jgi:6-pyruvoyltetrahydropterin/6-carboxytetrahydropterin synthase